MFAAALAFLIGFLQFSTRLRRARPRVHRTLGTIYVIDTLIGAPTAFLLGVQSDCALCRPPLALLGLLVLGTEIYLTWWPAIRRLRVSRVATDRAGAV